MRLFFNLAMRRYRQKYGHVSIITVFSALKKAEPLRPCL